MADSAQQAEIDWLYGLQHFGVKLGLDNIRRLLDVLDHPEAAYPSVSIAGTNGKGSVAAMLHSMLDASGLKTGLYTSPHLVRPNERIRLGDEDITGIELERQLRRMRETIASAFERGALETHPSFFEVITATALQSFRDHEVQAALLEVGLGGRLDATNAVDSDLSIIVSVDLDHTKTLGPTLGHIAAEKAGIVRPGTPVISGVVRQQAISVLQRICRERAAPLIDAHLAVRLAGEDGSVISLESDRNRYEGIRLRLQGGIRFTTRESPWPHSSGSPSASASTPTRTWYARVCPRFAGPAGCSGFVEHAAEVTCCWTEPTIRPAHARWPHSCGGCRGRLPWLCSAR